MLETLTHLIATYGYGAVGLFILLECMGIPVPSELALLVAAAAAGTGQLHIGGVFGVALVAALVGDAAGYWIGRRGGRTLLERHGRWLRLDATTLDRLEAFFARYGPQAVIIGRFVSIVRTYTALFAGVSRMPYARFTLYNVLGGGLWAVTFSALGYMFGRNLPVVERWVRTAGWGLLSMGVLGVATLLLWRWLTQHRATMMTWQEAVQRRPGRARLRTRVQRPLLWLRDRGTPNQYLGLHLTLGLVTSAACLWLFLGLAKDVLTNDPFTYFDRVVATRLHDDATLLSTAIFASISKSGLTLALGLSLLALGYAVWHRWWLQVWGWLASVCGSVALTALLVQVFERPRPVVVDPQVMSTLAIFPSGHALVALVVYGMLAYVIARAHESWQTRTAIVCGTALLVLVIGFSRVYLGVQYVSDVIGGWAAGGVWLSTCITSMELVRRGELGRYRERGMTREAVKERS